MHNALVHMQVQAETSPRACECAPNFAAHLQLSRRCGAQVSKARDHVESGVTHLVEAKKMQKKTRKLMCCILVTVLLIVALIIILVIQPWKLVNKQ